MSCQEDNIQQDSSTSSSSFRLLFCNGPWALVVVQWELTVMFSLVPIGLSLILSTLTSSAFLY